MSWAESRIRDVLATDLSILEPGLQLVGVEYPLPNAVGARGYVDLLCRDRFGRLVVVEIKRSKRTSREALHELHNYVELIQHRLGIGPADLRCLLVSTDWHGLRTPFASFVRTTPYDSRGIELSIVDENLQAAPVVLPEAPRLIELTEVARIFCFYHQEDRAQSIPLIAEGLEHVGCDHFIIIELNQSSSFEGMRFILYVALGTVDPLDPRTRALDALAEEVPEDAEWIPQGAVWAERAMGALKTLPSCDELEIGYPGKFRSIRTHEGWQVTRLHRYGYFANPEVHTDERLLDALVGGRGADNAFFSRWATPSHPTGWATFRSDLARPLSRNDSWAVPINSWLDEASIALSDTDFFVHLFNPMNFLRSLSAGRPELFDGTAPVVEIGAFTERSREGNLARLHGELVWDGTTHVDLVGTAHDVYGADLGIWLVFQVEPEMDHEFLRRCGLTYALFEMDTILRWRVTLEEGKLQRSECELEPYYNEAKKQVMVRARWGSLKFFTEFVHERQSELLALRREVRRDIVYDGTGASDPH